MWTKLEVHCEGTKDVKKNARSLLIQEHEYFEAKYGQSIIEMYDRFTKLLNEMAILGKVYDAEDTNTKFLRALPEEWDNKTTTIREARDLDDITLEELYGRLKTYDLEMQQRKNKKSMKVKSVALLMGSEKEQEEEPIEARIKDSRKKGKNIIESESTETDSDSEDEIYLSQMMAMFAKNFKRMKFIKRTGKFSKRPSFKKEDEKIEKGKSTIIKLDKANVECFNCGILRHFASDCRKVKCQGKGKTLLSEDEIDYGNLALMAVSSEKSESPKEAASLKTQVSIFSPEPLLNLDSNGIRIVQRSLIR
ncbi:uncharacterized protein LOC141665701 [Apium graveolens]|uniref:uncharacterized protein LOC141665701 n=1 Tax=Apium graveolens TaxID=4045 RepID=UPI003D7B70C9